MVNKMFNSEHIQIFMDQIRWTFVRFYGKMGIFRVRIKRLVSGNCGLDQKNVAALIRVFLDMESGKNFTSNVTK